MPTAPHGSHRLRVGFALCLTLLVLAGCASRPASVPPRGAGVDRDGAEPNPPADLASIPDAQPQVEPVREGGPNKPYEVFGQSYAPLRGDPRVVETGIASWYGRKFHGRRTASGEVYNMYAMTAAHKTLPIPSYARVRNPANGREVIVRINDRGPFVAGRIVDLSYTAALKLDVRGIGQVELERLSFEDIRSGAWRRDATVPSNEDAAVAADAPAPQPATDPVAIAAVADVPPPAPAEAVAPAIADAPTATAHTRPARGFWVQLGAFRERDGAVDFQRRVSGDAGWLGPLLAVFGEASMFRLQAGPYPTRAEAHGVAQRVRSALQLVPLIVERR